MIEAEVDYCCYCRVVTVMNIDVWVQAQAQNLIPLWLLSCFYDPVTVVTVCTVA